MQVRANKILVIKRDALGDVISVTPFLEVLRRNNPDAHIAYVVGSWSKKVLQDNPDIDELIVIDSEKWQKKLAKFRERSKLAKKLKPKGFDTVYILQGPAPMQFWERFAKKIGASNIIGFRNKGARTFLTKSVELPDHEGHLFKSLDKNRAEHFLDLLRVTGIQNTDNQGNRMYLQPADISMADDFFTKNNLGGKPVIAIAPGGAQNPGMKQLVKRWPAPRYIELIQKLVNDLNAKIIFIGGPGDQLLIKAIQQKLPSEIKNKTFDTAGSTSIHESAALIAKSNLFIGNDSGPLHIASTTKTPIIALFGPTNPVVDGPYKMNGQILFHKTKDSPCYTMDCNGHKPCIEQISVAEVYAVVKDLL